MRIIAGRLKGRIFSSPMVRGVRPTSERVRESVFCAIGPIIEGGRILDLYAGTGSFGFEALSRGATSVVFVEHNRRMASGLTATSSLFGVPEQVQILQMDAGKAAKKLWSLGDKFDVIFVDPPYESKAARHIQIEALLPDLLCTDGLLIVEAGQHPFELTEQGRLIKRFERKYGSTFITIFHLTSGVS